jgi:hypothetical protein
MMKWSPDTRASVRHAVRPTYTEIIAREEETDTTRHAGRTDCKGISLHSSVPEADISLRWWVRGVAARVAMQRRWRRLRWSNKY